MPILHNVTLYASPDDFADLRRLYVEVLGAEVVFEEPGHICCAGVGEGVAICVHEAEPGRPPGTRELFLRPRGEGAG